MAIREYSYKGKSVVVDQSDDQRAEVKIEDRSFTFMQHGHGLPMWTCDDAYFAAPELEQSVRHLIDYWHIVTDDEHRAPPLTESHSGHRAVDEPADEPKNDHKHDQKH